MRGDAKQFLIEGVRELDRALRAKVEIETYVFQKSFFESQQALVGQTFSENLNASNCFVLSDELFKHLSIRDNPGGVIGIASIWQSSLATFKVKDCGLYVLVESLEKPGNLGAIMRSAEATNVDAILIADPQVDVFNPNVIRASQGAVFNLNIFWGQSEEIFNCLRNCCINIIATTPCAKTYFWDCDMRNSCAICIGNEANGLSQLWLTQANQVAIPIFGTSADSLNASISAALCLYEARRQRRTQ